jgi:hypothetical protein
MDMPSKLLRFVASPAVLVISVAFYPRSDSLLLTERPQDQAALCPRLCFSTVMQGVRARREMGLSPAINAGKVLIDSTYFWVLALVI